ncbi:MAG: hypothetical protein HY270_05705 [Deltaproteobacteria bacterium]|nr:hypothetical protein [Deltaproteobacteria bacterium]
MRADRSTIAVMFATALLATWRCGCPIASAQESTKCAVAVLPFDAPSDTPSLDVAALRDAFSRVLTDTHKFVVVDRSRLDRARQEQKFSHSAQVDAATRTRFGKFVGAQYLVLGIVTDDSVSRPEELPYGAGTARTVHVSVEVQVVRVSTGQIVSARNASATVSARVTGADSGEQKTRKALEEAIQQVANDAVVAMVDVVYPLKIVDASDGSVRLNRGRGAGLEVGTALRCFSEGRKLIDPDTGESLGNSEAPSGRVRVTEVLPKITVAKVLQGTPGEGDTCRPADEGTEQPEDGSGTKSIHSY